MTLKEQLVEFYVTGVDNVMVVKFDNKIRIVIGTVLCVEVYSTTDLDDDFPGSPAVEVVTAEQLGAEP